MPDQTSKSDTAKGRAMSTKPAIDRRGFLKALGAGASASSLVAAGVVAPAPALAVESAADKKKKRYQETDHVKAYYRTNRY